MIASFGFLEDELREFSREEGVTLADCLETPGVDLRTRVKRLGAKEKARRKKCKVRFSLTKKSKAFQKKLHESVCQEVDTCRYDASKDLGSPCNGDISHGEVNIEKDRWQLLQEKKEYDIPAFVHGSIRS